MENFAKSLRLFKDYLFFAKNPAGANSCLKPYKTILSKLRLIKDLREIATLTCPNKRSTSQNNTPAPALFISYPLKKNNMKLRHLRGLRTKTQKVNYFSFYLRGGWLGWGWGLPPWETGDASSHSLKVWNQFYDQRYSQGKVPLDETNRPWKVLKEGNKN